MLSPLEELLEQRISQYDSMSRQEQLAKLEQILLVYAHGDAHVVEGMKLTYFAVVDAHKKIRDLDKIQKTLPLVNRKELEAQFRKIEEDMVEVTKLIFPYDEVMACEMVKEQYNCRPQ